MRLVSKVKGHIAKVWDGKQQKTIKSGGQDSGLNEDQGGGQQSDIESISRDRFRQSRARAKSKARTKDGGGEIG